jgi:hypothetical protein
LVPVGASAAVSRIIPALVVVEGIAIVDKARAYMGRIIAAAVVVGVIIVEIAWSYGQVKPRAAAAILDLNHIVPNVYAGIQKGRAGRYRAGSRRDAKEADRQQASRQNRCR